MIIAGRYSFKGGEEFISQHYPHLLHEIEQIISSVEANHVKTKKSKEKTMPGRILYSPKRLNRKFKRRFEELGWSKQKIAAEYSADFYSKDFTPRVLEKGAFREMDFIKDQLGVEVQFGKYAFMVYNVCAKMTILHNLGFIDAGVEIVPVKQFADEMSTGVSHFEQFVWDLKARGIADIDIPVLVLGIDVEPGGPDVVREEPLNWD